MGKADERGYVMLEFCIGRTKIRYATDATYLLPDERDDHSWFLRNFNIGVLPRLAGHRDILDLALGLCKKYLALPRKEREHITPSPQITVMLPPDADLSQLAGNQEDCWPEVAAASVRCTQRILEQMLTASS